MADIGNLQLALYLVAAVFFILSLAGLGKEETARTGNIYGIIGMAIAVLATLFLSDLAQQPYLWAVIIVGAVIGISLVFRVEMTSMPQLVALLHSFVGLAAVLVGVSSHLQSDHGVTGAGPIVHNIEIFAGVFIGGVTFTGSIVAWGKLKGTFSSAPLTLPGRHMLNLAMVIAFVVLAAFFVARPETGLPLLLLAALISFLLGIHLVAAIGGADMPVVVSMLNSYSGWTAAVLGFLLSNDLLIITGALVGSSGAILSYIMCKAMNRSFISVILGGFGSADGAGAQREITGSVTAATPEEASGIIRAGQRVVIIPGYGMAVAKAQHPIRELVAVLRGRNVDVRFAIHPVAGRLPGHMNVLLAEAQIPYDIVYEMDEMSVHVSNADVVIVVGANDIVNPSAEDDPNSPIFGMPVLKAWEAKHVFVLKRSMGHGYAGIDNPLCYRDNTRLVFGDAKVTVEAILTSLRVEPISSSPGEPHARV